MPRFRQQLSALTNENVRIDISRKSLNKEYFMIKSLKEVISHHSEFYIMHIFSPVLSMVLYFG